MPLSLALYPMTSDLGPSHRQKHQERVKGVAGGTNRRWFPLSGIPARKGPSGRCPYAFTSPGGTSQ